MPSPTDNRRQPKTERVQLRLTSAQKRRIEHAASLKGVPISKFIVSSADAAAVRTIKEHDVGTLANQDREVFVKALG